MKKKQLDAICQKSVRDLLTQANTLGIHLANTLPIIKEGDLFFMIFEKEVPLEQDKQSD